ncbi:hypothetical protein K402DRAFT_234614 [Aulographum hederae CBS 113979]|uniref:Uncharacterized protein n=1 Tax=Aulographum hederae CBS 113979 TaxID=1176131 RepID=A0A6G1GKM4_9PEZI|nr:hypothetical protein K402DRAFT_234614 [Aulographum hederae CBS 113979]
MRKYIVTEKGEIAQVKRMEASLRRVPWKGNGGWLVDNELSIIEIFVVFLVVDILVVIVGCAVLMLVLSQGLLRLQVLLEYHLQILEAIELLRLWRLSLLVVTIWCRIEKRAAILWILVLGWGRHGENGHAVC